MKTLLEFVKSKKKDKPEPPKTIPQVLDENGYTKHNKQSHLTMYVNGMHTVLHYHKDGIWKHISPVADMTPGIGANSLEGHLIKTHK